VPFVIAKADLLVHAFPPDYSQCFSAFQPWNSSVLLQPSSSSASANGVIDKERQQRGYLGWSFLRNVGVALDLGRGEWNITGRSDYNP
jgi:hypothetical protein